MPSHLLEVICGAVAVAAPVAFGLVDCSASQGGREIAAAEAVMIAPGAIDYHLPGEFLVGGRPVSATVETATFPDGLRVMRHQVSLTDYQRCVDAGACKPAGARPAGDTDSVPVTGVNFLDAIAYADWYAATTGQRWRLPTAAEWAFAAGERFVGEEFSEADDPDNPAIAWIRRYREEAAYRRQPDPHPKPRGHFGPNSNGVEDLSGNVWEWTSTCYVRVTLADDRKSVLHRTENCGVHVAEGSHRAFMSDFIRDGKSGGCAVGTPPDNLGIRLVLDDPETLPARLVRIVRALSAQRI